MTSPEREPLLPRVEEADLLSLAFEEITDPTHTKRWKEFAATNPQLATEVLKRTYVQSRDLHESHQFELQKFAIDTVTFVVKALEQAAKRRVETANGGGAGEVPPLSA